MRHRKQLTTEAFGKLVDHLNVGERGIEIARLVLVDGLAQKEVADRFSITPSAVSRYVQTAWQTYVNSSDVPEGMQRVTVVLPKDKATLVVEWEKQEMIRRLELDL